MLVREAICRGTFVPLIVLFLLSRASGQETKLRFQNSMQSDTDVRITAVGSTRSANFSIGSGRVVDFTFRSKLFDIQVIPRDEPNSGFRFTNVNLRELAATANGQTIKLDGAFGPPRTMLVYQDHCGGCTYYWQTFRGERVAVGLSADLKIGGKFSVESPKFSY